MKWATGGQLDLHFRVMNTIRPASIVQNDDKKSVRPIIDDFTDANDQAYQKKLRKLNKNADLDCNLEFLHQKEVLNKRPLRKRKLHQTDFGNDTDPTVEEKVRKIRKSDFVEALNNTVD